MSYNSTRQIQVLYEHMLPSIFTAVTLCSKTFFDIKKFLSTFIKIIKNHQKSINQTILWHVDHCASSLTYFGIKAHEKPKILRTFQKFVKLKGYRAGKSISALGQVWDFPATARVWVWISCTHSCLDCLSRRVRMVYKHEWFSLYFPVLPCKGLQCGY